jgi:hypothetical protein
MATDSPTSMPSSSHSISESHGLSKGDEYAARSPRNPRFKGVSESTAVNPILGVAMVGILGKSPRLAMRAARVLLADSYASRSSTRQRRPRGDTRRRGE